MIKSHLVTLGKTVLAKKFGFGALILLLAVQACGGQSIPADNFVTEVAGTGTEVVGAGGGGRTYRDVDSISGRWQGGSQFGNSGTISLTIEMNADSTGLVQGLLGVPFYQHGEDGRVEGVFSAPVFVSDRGVPEFRTWFEASHNNLRREKPFRVGVDAWISDSGIVYGHVRSGYAADSYLYSLELSR